MKIKYQIMDVKTKAVLSHTRPGETMGTTLFDTEKDAKQWLKDHKLAYGLGHEFIVGSVEVQ